MRRGGLAWTSHWILALAAFLLLSGIGKTAQADGAPPARSARLTFTEGYVHIDRPDHGGPGDPGLLNMPLVQGQAIVAGGDGQAEVEFEDGSLVRLTPNTTLVLSRLAADSSGSFDTRLSLTGGLAYFELRAASKFAYRVDAGGDLIWPVENTTFRVNLDEAPAAIAVLDGTAHVERQDSYRADIRSGETFRSDIGNAGRYFLSQEIASDSWDQWNESRDQEAVDAAASQTSARSGFAGTEGYGWSDLDANGSWYNVPGQGQVWQPQGGDAADFDPYGNGAWVWYPNSGYLWASSYSWGWTPFRCGAWSFWDGFGWGWSPNIGCGGFGFAGGYGGYGYGGGYVNILLPPRRYPNHHPEPGSGWSERPHPILRVGQDHPPVRTGLQGPAPAQTGFRRIAGVTATPLRPVGGGYTPRGGSAVGASLNRDFPVDRVTRTPVLGLQPGRAWDTQHSYVGIAATPGGDNRAVSSPMGQMGYRAPVDSGMRQVNPRPVTVMGPPAQGNYVRPAGTAPPPVRPVQPSMQRSSPPAAPSRAPSFSAPAPSHAAPAPAPSGGGGGKK